MTASESESAPVTDSPVKGMDVIACREHWVMDVKEKGGVVCPVCETDAVADPTAVSDVSFSPEERRWNIGLSEMVDLIKHLTTDAEAAGVGPVSVAVAEITKSEVPAGYNHAERFWNVVVVETGPHSRELIRTSSVAQEAIQAIQEGDGYLEASEADRTALEPDCWGGVADIYCRDVEYERVDSDTLRMTMDGFPSDSAYSDARREIGHIARSRELSVRTVDAGGRWSEGVIEVYADE